MWRIFYSPASALTPLRNGEVEGGVAEIAAARRMDFDEDWQFTRLDLGIPQQPAATAATAH